MIKDDMGRIFVPFSASSKSKPLFLVNNSFSLCRGGSEANLKQC